MLCSLIIYVYSEDKLVLVDLGNSVFVCCRLHIADLQEDEGTG